MTIVLRKGIPFNTPPVTPGMDYGELTADDVVWMLNRHNLRFNPRSSAGDGSHFAAFFGEARAVDTYTVEIPLAKPVFFGLPLTEMGIQRATPAVESKQAFELLGPERVQDVSVGTGRSFRGNGRQPSAAWWKRCPTTGSRPRRFSYSESIRSPT